MSRDSKPLVLAIDDSRDIHALLRPHVKDEGAELISAMDGATGLRLARDKRPDLILLDVLMPEMDGFEVCGRLKLEPVTAEIPLVFLTGLSDPAAKRRALDQGALDFFSKPFDPNELRARVRATLRSVRQANHLKDQTHLLAQLYEYATALKSLRTVEAIAAATVDLAASLTSSRRVSLMLLDQSASNLRMVHARGNEAGAIDADWRQPVGTGIAGQAIAQRRAIVINSPEQLSHPSSDVHRPSADRDQSAQFGQCYESDFFASVPVVAVPLDANNAPIGVLNVTDRCDGKPYAPEEIESLLCVAKTCGMALSGVLEHQSAEKTLDALIVGLASLAERRDLDTGLHLIRLSDFASILAHELSRNDKYGSVLIAQYIADLCRFIPLHDIGKVGIPDSILLKPGKLTVEEFEIMKTHCDIGAQTLRTVAAQLSENSSLQMAIDIVQSHHEKHDGSGYPRGLAGDAIPLAARITALVDVYDALTSDRPYHAAWPHAKVVDHIWRQSGTHFDPDLVAAFLVTASRFASVNWRLSLVTAIRIGSDVTPAA